MYRELRAAGWDPKPVSADDLNGNTIAYELNNGLFTHVSVCGTGPHNGGYFMIDDQFEVTPLELVVMFKLESMARALKLQLLDSKGSGAENGIFYVIGPEYSWDTYHCTYYPIFTTPTIGINC
jgi:hypothetical protein